MLVLAVSATMNGHVGNDELKLTLRTKTYIIVGVTWTPRLGAPRALWNALASSSDGTYLAAAQGIDNGQFGFIYTSSDR